jgi:hypothetical protein
VTICSHGMSTRVFDAILFQRLMEYAKENNIILDEIFGQNILNPLQFSELNEVKFIFKIELNFCCLTKIYYNLKKCQLKKSCILFCITIKH